MNKIHKNYDAVFKDALTLFKDKTLDFLGLHDIPPITEPLSAEFVDVDVKTNILDLVFGLQDSRGLHIEEEVDLTYNDLLRIGGYHLDLCRTYTREFITVIFAKNPVRINGIRTGQLTFEPVIVQCSDFDADAILEKLKTAVSGGEPVNELELIYLPLFKSVRCTPTELFTESTKLITAMRADDKAKHKMAALLIVLCGKVVDKAVLEKYAEEIRHMKNAVIEFLMKLGEEDGIKLGEERGMKLGEERRKLKETETVLKMLSRGLSSEDIIYYTGISQERLDQILSLVVA
jgi:hypothetical protein